MNSAKKDSKESSHVLRKAIGHLVENRRLITSEPKQDELGKQTGFVEQPIPLSTLSILNCYQEFANFDGTNALPSLFRVAARTTMSKSLACRKRKILIKSGFLTENQAGGVDINLNKIIFLMQQLVTDLETDPKKILTKEIAKNIPKYLKTYKANLVALKGLIPAIAAVDNPVNEEALKNKVFPTGNGDFLQETQPEESFPTGNAIYTSHGSSVCLSENGNGDAESCGLLDSQHDSQETQSQESILRADLEGDEVGWVRGLVNIYLNKCSVTFLSDQLNILRSDIKNGLKIKSKSGKSGPLFRKRIDRLIGLKLGEDFSEFNLTPDEKMFGELYGRYTATRLDQDKKKLNDFIAANLEKFGPLVF